MKGLIVHKITENEFFTFQRELAYLSGMRSPGMGMLGKLQARRSENLWTSKRNTDSHVEKNTERLPLMSPSIIII